MNDFVKIQKNLTDEEPDFSWCKEKNYFSSGERCSIINYSLKNRFNDIGISLNEATGQMTLRGNFGMFWNGHNICFSLADFNHAIGNVSDIINVDLLPAIVKEFDHSAIVTTTIKPKLIIENHLKIRGHCTKEVDHGKYFEKKGQQLVKMYDATARMKQIYSKAKREEIYVSAGIDPTCSLIRFEKKIKNPHAYFKRIVSMSDLLNPEFILQCNTDLMETYNNITKLGCHQIPKNKKYLTSATIPLIVGKELESEYGFDFTDLIKRKISAIDESILSKDDKKSRRRQIKTNLNRISGEVVSVYDIGKQLAESLKIDSSDVG